MKFANLPITPGTRFDHFRRSGNQKKERRSTCQLDTRRTHLLHSANDQPAAIESSNLQENRSLGGAGPAAMSSPAPIAWPARRLSIRSLPQDGLLTNARQFILLTACSARAV